MTREHAVRLEKLARGLFRTMTPEQGVVLIEMLRPYDPHRAYAVLKTHAKDHEFLSLPNLKTGLFADDAKQRAGRQHNLRQRTVDWIRQQNPKWYADLDDYATIHAHYAECWNVVEGGTADNAGKQATRRMIRGHAKQAGFEIGLNQVEAQELADACIRLAPGEIIPRVEFFNPIEGDQEREQEAQAAKVQALRELAVAS